MKKISIITFTAILLAAFVPRTFAQTGELNLEKYANSSKVIPISMSGFSGTAQEVLRFDLEVAGFEFVGTDSASFLLTGKNNGQVEGRLTDKNKTTMLSRAYTGGNTRSQAHALANDIIFAITQRKGVTQGKIAFRVGEGRNSEIYVADYDGANAIAVTSDKSLVSAPTWVPGQRKLFYVSYKSGFPDILAHDLTTGARLKFASYGGGNYSPAISPDGRRVAMILSKTGNPELFVCNIDGSGLKQLTKTKEGESSPCWSPDGGSICFVSKMSGRAGLYRIDADGGATKRITTAGVGGNLTEPDWSPDGRSIVFTSQMGNFNICTVPAQGGSATVLVEGEDPAWGANSRTVIFTRRKSGGRVLSLLDVPTKHVKDVTRISGSSSQPCWAK
jgi:TolB protein